jgi:3-hydroxy-9,10-secoandrosta-1,3,5(10)-triene-9,17-dione monooxygenase reductase component
MARITSQTLRMAKTSLAPVLPLRDTFRTVPTSVAVVAGRHADGDLVAMTVGSLQSASLDPPLVTVSYQTSSRTWARLRDVRQVGISVLASAHRDVARKISGPASDRMTGVHWDLGSHPQPRVRGAVAWLECHLDDVVVTGDHELAVYRVLGCDAAHGVEPLVFVNGGFGSAQAAAG